MKLNKVEYPSVGGMSTEGFGLQHLAAITCHLTSVLKVISDLACDTDLSIFSSTILE